MDRNPDRRFYALKGSFIMKFSAAFASICALFLIVFTVPAVFGEIPIEIQISPSTLNLAYQGTVVTVHTDIPFSAVEGATVSLNSVAIAWWKADNQGNFVAKFKAEEVMGIVNPGDGATLSLTGETTTGDYFSGTDEIRVIEIYGNK
jgi:hypothetical protein